MRLKTELAAAMVLLLWESYSGVWLIITLPKVMRLKTELAAAMVLLLWASYSGVWLSGTCLLAITSQSSNSSRIWNKM